MSEIADISRMEPSELVEQISAAVHDAWMAQQRRDGNTSRISRGGEEMMVPYAQLSESCKEYDRVTVRAVLSALEPLGYAVVKAMSADAFLQILNEPAAPVPPASGLSDERLAEIRRLNEGLRQRLALAASLCITDGHMSAFTLGNVVDDIDELLAEIARTRSDAALGAALLAVLATLRNDDRLTIDKFFDGCEVRMALCGAADLPEENAQTLALAALLSRVPEERTRT